MAHSHTPRNSCVRFVFGIAAASRNTRLQAARCDLTWAGLAPADRASFAGAFPHSITSSARASSVGGTSRPSAFAVLRLMTSSNLVGAWTGRSLGFAPLRMRWVEQEGDLLDARRDLLRVEVTSLAARYHLPAVYYFRGFTDVGGLLSYGNDIRDNYRRAASYADG